jgi:hypothetical protein
VQADFLREIISAAVCPRMFQGLFAMYLSGLTVAFGRGKVGQKANSQFAKGEQAKSRGVSCFSGLWQPLGSNASQTLTNF